MRMHYLPSYYKMLEARKKVELKRINKYLKKHGKKPINLSKAFEKVKKEISKKDRQEMFSRKKGEVKPVRRTRNLLRDYKLKAKKPGKRISKSGRTYYEYRENRSDIGRI